MREGTGECGAVNEGARACEACGRERPASPGGFTPPPLRRCAGHGGGVVLVRGPGPAGSAAWCPVAREYSLGAPCPFVCPVCRGPLEWHGGCYRCFGSASGRREDWAFPGGRQQRSHDHRQHIRGGPHLG